MSDAHADAPGIPPRLQRPLAAIWISVGLHAALIALVQVAPPSTPSLGAPAIEARLVTRHTAPIAEATPPAEPEADAPETPPPATPVLAPSPAPEALPVAPPPPAAAPPRETPPAAPVVAEPAPSVPPAQAATPAAAPDAILTSSVDLTYYSARDVDVHPHALLKIVPEYPPDADHQRLSGKVRLQLKLEADGRVSDIEVVEAQPPGVFDASALKAFRDARFAPAQKKGRPVRALVLIEVVYDWEGRR